MNRAMLNTTDVNIDWTILISDEFAYNFSFWVGVVALNCLNGLGVVSNIINITVFVKQGLRERGNFTLFWLSISDLMGTVAQAAMSKGSLWDVELGPIVMNGQSFYSLVYYIRAMWSDISSGLTMFISIERCICVIRPLHFNSSFIARHGKVIVSVIIVTYIVYYLPFLTPAGLEAELNVETNTSIYYAVYAPYKNHYEDFNDFFGGILLCILVPCFVFACIILMYRGLYKSSNIRRTLTASLGSDQAQMESGLSTKERRVVKMVFVLACLYMLSSFPQIVFISIYHFFDMYAFDIQEGKTRNLSLILDPLSIYILGIYSSFSIFVYYLFSSSFRKNFHEMVTLKLLVTKNEINVVE
ncbi:P2Y purinoceptor 2 [Biomphalaria glabrata]|nr:P2Y purinoceptor 2 [Biomphalaria glabrata]